jgi:hypothetical protein
MHLLCDFNKKYLGHRDYDPNVALLGKSFYDKYLSLAAVSNDKTYHGIHAQWPPLPRDLYRSLFGRPSINHSFLQDACFKTLYVIVLKSRFFELTNILALHECHPLLSHLLCACVHLRNYDFLWLWQYNQSSAKQSTLDDNKAYAFLACLLHYNLSVALTVRFLGNNYTGEYRDIPSIVAFLRLHGIADDIISDYNRVMTVGCPNHFNPSTTRDNALLYWRRGNRTPLFAPRSTRSWRP